MASQKVVIALLFIAVIGIVSFFHEASAQNAGSVSLDRTVYPVPFGDIDNFMASNSTTPAGRSLFPIHQTSINLGGLSAGETLGTGNLVVHIRINDPDFDVSTGIDSVAQAVSGTNSTGPLKIIILRGSDVITLGYAGGPQAQANLIDVGDNALNSDNVRQFGPISEVAPDAGIFEFDLVIPYHDGPASSECPETIGFEPLSGSGKSKEHERFDEPSNAEKNYCILAGDNILVQYTDPVVPLEYPNVVTDSAVFHLRNGVLQSDKSVYIKNSTIILTLIEPDFDYDNDMAESYVLDIIEWDSDSATVTLGDKGNNMANFDPLDPRSAYPYFRETGDSTGIFQTSFKMPIMLDETRINLGEEVVLEYTDWGPNRTKFVGADFENINLTVFSSNFGATIELDQKTYTWTDKVYITIVAPDYNFDSDSIDEIGKTEFDPIKISTREFNLDRYRLVETGTATGVFTGEVILTGFAHDADGNTNTGTNGIDTNPRTSPTSGGGPTDGFLEADNDDGITVLFQPTDADAAIVGSALIRWNIGEISWLEASYPASGTGVVRLVDPDMNLDPEAIDNFVVDVWSESDAGGIDLTVTETNEATGIFDGTVLFTTTDASSGNRLRVAEGDTITAEYEDNTLPAPYTTADELDITGTSKIEEITVKHLIPTSNEFALSVNTKVEEAFIEMVDTELIRTVDSDNMQETIDDLVQNTIFLAITEDRGVLAKLNDFPFKEELISEYKEKLSEPQQWPFANGDSVPLLESGDYVTKIRWSAKDPLGDINTIAIVDNTGKIKFEPLMYFTSDQVIVGGSSHRLVVTNSFGWEVVTADLTAYIIPHDNCGIQRDEDRIAQIDEWAAPMWHVQSIKGAQKYTQMNCPQDAQKELECADATAEVAYSAFMPNWEISPTKFEIKRGDLPMTTGVKTLNTEVVCAPEFPVTAFLPLVIALAGIVVLMRTKFNISGLN